MPRLHWNWKKVQNMITIDGESAGKMATNMGGKLVLSVEFEAGKEVSVNVVKA